MQLLQGNTPKKYSVERLRCLYSSLLLLVDSESEDVCQRGMEEIADGNVVSNFLSLRRFTIIRRNSENDVALEKQELATVFADIAFNSVWTCNDSTLDRERSTTRAIKIARQMVDKVVNIIREIGEVVVNAEPAKESASLRDDETFAYFCEKAILVMLVEIVRSKPGKTGSEASSCLHGVVWSPKVKAQVLQTLTLLISGARDKSALYFMLSQHCINQLLMDMQQFTNWTDPSLEDMLAAYLDLLKTLALHLCGSPEIFAFYTFQPAREESVLFPLFTSIVQVATSPYAQSDSYVHATCLNLVVGLLRIPDNDVHSWISRAEAEHWQLCHHIVRRLTSLYRRIANLTTGPVVDGIRSNAIGGQLTTLNDQFDALNDLLWCNNKLFSCRLCEALLNDVVYLLVRDLIPLPNRKFLTVGASDRDVIPAAEAAAQASSLVLSRVFQQVKHPPFLRMAAVVLFHPMMTAFVEVSNDKSDQDVFERMTALSNLVQGKDIGTAKNIYKEELLTSLCGEYGDWRFTTTTALIENAIKALDTVTLQKLEILPVVSKEGRLTTSTVEIGLASFLSRKHNCQSSVSTMALESATSLSVSYLEAATVSFTRFGDGMAFWGPFLRESPLLLQLKSVKSFFFERLLETQKSIQVNDIVVDLVEAIVKSRYKPAVRNSLSQQDRRGMVCKLSNHSSNTHCSGPLPLTRKARDVDANEIEETRMNALMAIHFRAVCRVVDRFHDNLRRNIGELNNGESLPLQTQLQMDMDDDAGGLQNIFCCLMDKPHAGVDLNLHGRMTFGFSIDDSGSFRNASNASQGREQKSHTPRNFNRARTFSEEMICRASSSLLLVLDPTDIFIVKRFARKDTPRGTILCCISLLDIFAAAADESRLHIAVRHTNLGCLIKNGNMVLNFDSTGTCLIVAQYLDRCRALLRQELYCKMIQLFHDNTDSAARPSDFSLVDIDELPRVNTF